MKSLNSLLLAIFILFFLSSYGCVNNVNFDPSYEKEVKDFRKSRVKFLKSEKGYLNLVGLFWLSEGKNSFGSNVENDLQFPKGFPQNFGFATKSDNVLNFTYSRKVTLNNNLIQNSVKIDIDDRSQIFSFGSFQWFVIKSGEDYAIRMRNLESPRLKEDLDLRFYEIDKSWRIVGQFDPYDDYKTRIITNVRNIDSEQKFPGIIYFKKNGESFSFEPTITEVGMEVMFTDETTGDETFSGGRFLLLQIPDEHGDVILDFNKALNFPCAVNDYTTCPIPPKTNHLTMMVPVGEKKFK